MGTLEENTEDTGSLEVSQEIVQDDTSQEEIVQDDTSQEEIVQDDTSQEEYTPNTNYRVHGGEQSFDDFILSAVKSKEDEDRVRELYERAAGLDYVKEDRQKLRDENSNLLKSYNEYGQVKSELEKAGHFLKEGDLSSFFETYGIKEEDVAQHLLNKQQMLEDPLLANQYDAQRRSRSQAYDLQQQNSRLQSQLKQQQAYADQMATKQRTSELNSVLHSPEVSSQVQSFDARMGEGSFQREVINRGLMHYQQTGIDLTPQQAAEQVANLAGFSLSQGNQANSNTYMNRPVHNVQQQGQQQGQQQQTRVIPNISGSATTPVRRVPKSIDDLRKIHQSLL